MLSNIHLISVRNERGQRVRRNPNIYTGPEVEVLMLVIVHKYSVVEVDMEGWSGHGLVEGTWTEMRCQ